MIVPIDKLKPNPEQPRQAFDQVKLNELAESIKQHGIIQPIVVESNGDGYIIHDGERRWRAARIAGLTDVPISISNQTDEKDKLIRAIAANEQRDDLNPAEKARGYQKLHDDFGLSDQQIADQFQKSRSVVANARRLLNLPDLHLKALAAGEISERQAMAILPLFILPELIKKQLQAKIDIQNLMDSPGTSGNMSSETIRQLIDKAHEHLSRSFRGYEFPKDETIPGNEGCRIIKPLCQDCPYLYKSRCYYITCYQQKAYFWKQGHAPPDYAPIWQLESGIRAWLLNALPNDGLYTLTEIKNRTETGIDILDDLVTGDLLPGPRRAGDVFQACNNVLAQLKQQEETKKHTANPSWRYISGTTETCYICGQHAEFHNNGWRDKPGADFHLCAQHYSQYQQQITGFTDKEWLKEQLDNLREQEQLTPPDNKSPTYQYVAPKEAETNERYSIFECPRCQQKKIKRLTGHGHHVCQNCGAEWETSDNFFSEVNNAHIGTADAKITEVSQSDHLDDPPPDPALELQRKRLDVMGRILPLIRRGTMTQLCEIDAWIDDLFKYLQSQTSATEAVCVQTPQIESAS